MDLRVVRCAFVLLTFAGACFGQELILPERINGTVGENVVITPMRIPDPPHQYIRWSFNTDTSILSGPSGNITIQPPYTNRVHLDTSTLALELRSLTDSDTGRYTLSVQTPANPFTNETSLHVLVPVSNVKIIPSDTELVELNSTVSLVCSASGSFLSFIWMNGSSEVTAGERVQLTNSNSNLTITSVIRGDTGPYQCEASNSFSKANSSLLSLNISHGPENVTVVAAPVGPFYSSGSKLILTCSADSSPAAEFQWAVNGTELGKLGQELKLSNIQSSDSGNYTCMAHNKQTLRYATSDPISIAVLGTNGGGGGSLSAGAIAGIVIGVLLGVAGIAGLIFYFVKDKKMPKITSGGNKQDGATPNERQLEMHYAEINHLQSNQGQQRVPAMPRAQTSHVSQHNKTAASNPAAQTVYADVRNI